MLAALGTLAFAASMMAHEGLGHGGYCLAVGGHNTLLTPWSEPVTFLLRLDLESRRQVPVCNSVMACWLGWCCTGYRRTPPDFATFFGYA